MENLGPRAMFSTAGMLIVLLFCTTACESTEDAEPDEDPTDECDQTCEDRSVGIAVSFAAVTLYNQNGVGKSGYFTKDAPCPLGGTALISGTVYGNNDGTTSVDLQMAMTGCRVNASGANIVIDGTVAEVGSFDAANYSAINFSSAELTYSGTVAGEPLSSQTCAVFVNRTNSTYTGSVCDRTF